ncbi:hypothetical protein L9F63_011641, partial [Diploptera punctata]
QFKSNDHITHARWLLRFIHKSLVVWNFNEGHVYSIPFFENSAHGKNQWSGGKHNLPLSNPHHIRVPKTFPMVNHQFSKQNQIPVLYDVFDFKQRI